MVGGRVPELSLAAAATSPNGCWRSKTQKDAVGAVLFFNVAHYVLRPWPWILVASAPYLAILESSDIQRAFPNLDPSLLGDDIAYPAMLKFCRSASSA